MSEKVDTRLVKGIVPPTKGNVIVYDGGHHNAVVGFGIRATAGGAKFFILNYRISKRERRYTIGAYPTWSVAAAREEAKELRKRIDRGEDPLELRKAKLDAPTVADLCAHDIEHYLPTKRPKGQREDRDMIDKWVRPTLGKRRVAEVRRADIAKLHRSLTDTPYRANRILALLGKMFRIAMHEDLAWRGTNPAKKDQTGRDGIRPTMKRRGNGTCRKTSADALPRSWQIFQTKKLQT